jgi:hypothetical protein
VAAEIKVGDERYLGWFGEDLAKLVYNTNCIKPRLDAQSAVCEVRLAGNEHGASACVVDVKR